MFADRKVTIGVGVVAGLGAVLLLWRWKSLRDQQLEGDEEIDFADNDQHKLSVLLQYVDPQLTQLQTDVDKLKEMRGIYEREEFKQQFGRHMMGVDEQLTKLMIAVDSVELKGDNVDVRDERKRCIQRIHAVADEVGKLC